MMRSDRCKKTRGRPSTPPPFDNFGAFVTNQLVRSFRRNRCRLGRAAAVHVYIEAASLNRHFASGRRSGAAAQRFCRTLVAKDASNPMPQCRQPCNRQFLVDWWMTAVVAMLVLLFGRPQAPRQ
jgi:hypothetical protein